MRHYTILLFVSIAISQLAARGQAPAAKAPMTDADKIKNALSAAPAGIAKDAAVMDMGATPGTPMVEFRKGTNGWTCLPDMASTPGNDPMCLDKIAMQWMQAWMVKKDPKLPGVGFGYMLQGGSEADNDDPFADKPKPGKSWINEPPHLMVFGTKVAPGTYTSERAASGAWVMFKGTPYEHLMVPVK